MKEIALPIELANAILQYLGQRPYQEVAGLIAGMQKAAQEAAQEAAGEAIPS
jgi:hypothetical protein